MLTVRERVRKIHAGFRTDIQNDTLSALLASKINQTNQCYDFALTKYVFAKGSTISNLGIQQQFIMLNI